MDLYLHSVLRVCVMMLKGVVQMEDGSSSGIVSDNAQVLVLDDLEFEVI